MKLPNQVLSPNFAANIENLPFNNNLNKKLP